MSYLYTLISFSAVWSEFWTLKLVDGIYYLAPPATRDGGLGHVWYIATASLMELMLIIFVTHSFGIVIISAWPDKVPIGSSTLTDTLLHS